MAYFMAHYKKMTNQCFVRIQMGILTLVLCSCIDPAGQTKKESIANNEDLGKDNCFFIVDPIKVEMGETVTVQAKDGKIWDDIKSISLLDKTLTEDNPSFTFKGEASQLIKGTAVERSGKTIACDQKLTVENKDPKQAKGLSCALTASPASFSKNQPVEIIISVKKSTSAIATIAIGDKVLKNESESVTLHPTESTVVMGKVTDESGLESSCQVKIELENNCKTRPDSIDFKKLTDANASYDANNKKSYEDKLAEIKSTYNLTDKSAVEVLTFESFVTRPCDAFRATDKKCVPLGSNDADQGLFKLDNRIYKYFYAKKPELYQTKEGKIFPLFLLPKPKVAAKIFVEVCQCRQPREGADNKQFSEEVASMPPPPQTFYFPLPAGSRTADYEGQDEAYYYETMGAELENKIVPPKEGEIAPVCQIEPNVQT